MKNIFIEGTGGLGNCLFQIAAAIHYCEKYDYQLVLIDTEHLLYGTSNSFERQKCLLDSNNQFVTYDKSIFKNIKMISKDKEYGKNCIIIHNNFTDNKIIPNNQFNIIIRGYNQNVDLFRNIFDKIPLYLHLNDDSIKTYITNKYGDISNGILVGIRIGIDFQHMKKITPDSYKKALNYYKGKNMDCSHIYIIADVKNISDHHFNLQKHFNCIEIDEPDIIQFYFGLMCKHYILSESTFHLWIAYLGTLNSPEKNVICFNNTDITNRNLYLDNWITIDC
jgi:hypothetical protein